MTWYETVQRPAGGAGGVGRPGARRRRAAVGVRRAARRRQGAAGDPDVGAGRRRRSTARSSRSPSATRRPRTPARRCRRRLSRSAPGCERTDAPPPVPVAAAPGGDRDWRQALIGWSFALPFVLLFGVFMAGPILISFVTSFTDMRVTDIRKPVRRRLRRVRQLRRRVPGPDVPQGGPQHRGLRASFAVPLTIGLGLLVALGLNQARVRLRNVLRIGYFLPVRHEHRRHRRRVAADPRHRRRPDQRPARRASASTGRAG